MQLSPNYFNFRKFLGIGLRGHCLSALKSSEFCRVDNFTLTVSLDHCLLGKFFKTAFRNFLNVLKLMFQRQFLNNIQKTTEDTDSMISKTCQVNYTSTPGKLECFNYLGIESRHNQLVH